MEKRSPRTKRKAVKNAVRGNPQAGTGRSSTRPQRKKRKQPITLTEDDVLDRWATVREEKSLSEDSDVARFLLSW
jgi:hypothetical protein